MSKNLKIFLGLTYLTILFSFLYIFFTTIEINRLNDFAYYKELQSNLDTFDKQQYINKYISTFLYLLLFGLHY